MIRTPALTLGSLALMLILLLVLAGCTQPSGITPVPATQVAVMVPVTQTSGPAIAPPANQSQKSEVALLAAGFAGKIDKQAFTTALAEGDTSPAFAAIVGQLNGFKATDNRITYVYTFEQRNGTNRFLITNTYGLPVSPKFHEEYTDAPAELKVPVTGPVAAGPYTDRWGTFVSGFAPIDLGSNTPGVLLGVDFLS